MSEQQKALLEMLDVVAQALGEELCQQVAFVGGCTTALLVTDEVTLEDLRFTDDVDLVVQLAGYAGWPRLMEQLRSRGFMESPLDDVNCRMRLGELKVDFMPSDKAILGYSNRWFDEGFQHARLHRLPSGAQIRVFAPPYFLGTKFEAYKGRGGGDTLNSKDIEDIVNLVDGREELVAEVSNAALPLKQYLSEHMTELINNRDFSYVVQSAARGDRGREAIIFGRLKQMAKG
ncbi:MULTISPECIES: hypothetical protein [Pseudomonas]|jgi:predicted nucleotidyltransferase|uniref:Nucleotidyl transferase AbiEii toxin, Type IV TA system n=1 Tax=Pseudomonas gingeri TaxID=117681 RepID=A0A7Y7WI67_9PSED|nr:MULTISPECIES: hypothetical protein [Pseudomonas]MPQ65484.1 hypothetical protein [Pseudomonas sp. MWU12-2323]NWB49981.1 hypothetical protein [Pseudomonas gingeri]NWB86138.1 hypothetical protein [Pseudomonas gingeri]